MAVSRPLLAAFAPVAVAALLGCGPTTLWSSAFPTRYHVVTRVRLTEAGATRVQERVAACEVVDQTDSIAANFAARARSARHALPTADGGVLVLGDLRPCRWVRRAELAEGRTPSPLVARSNQPRPPGAKVRSDGEAVWLDDPVDPSRLEVWDMDALLVGEGPLAVTVELAVTDAEVALGLAEEVPWLVIQAGIAAERRARDAADPDVHPWTPRADPTRFEGVTARAWRLAHGARCESVPDDATGVVALARTDACLFLGECLAGRDVPCREPLGGLGGEVDADAARIRFALDAARPGWVGALPRHDRLPPTAPLWREVWAPEACLAGPTTPPGGACFPPIMGAGTAPARYPDLYDVDAGVVVALDATPRIPSLAAYTTGASEDDAAR